MSEPPPVVRPVRGRGDWRAFYAVRAAIYRGDPVAVTPLASEQRLLLDTRRNPFWQHAEYEAFVCWRGERPVGRIVAIVDRMHQEHYADRTGFFGFFECHNDVAAARALIQAAAAALTARGCDAMRGPVNPSLKGEFGVVVSGNDLPPAIMMAHTPAWYDDLLTGCGLKKVHDFFAFTVDQAGAKAREDRWRALAELCARIRARHPELVVETATAANVDATLAEINVLANRIREPVWGFVPITEAEVDFLVKRARPLVAPDLVVTVSRDNEMVGFLIALPDVNWALARARGRFDAIRMVQLPFLLKRNPRARILALGADPRYAKAGIAPLLFETMTANARQRLESVELSWISEENLPSLRALRHVLPLEPAKTYRLYEMPLATPRQPLAGTAVPR